MMSGIGGKNLSRVTSVLLNFKPFDCIVTYVTINIIKIIKLKFMCFFDVSSLHAFLAQKHTNVHKLLNSFPSSLL